MRIIISGRHLDVTEAIRDYAEKKIGRIKKYFDSIIEIDVTLSVEKSKSEGEQHTADVLVFANGKKLKARATESILYAAIDEVTDILENQLKKYKEKLKSRQHNQINVKESNFSIEDINVDKIKEEHDFTKIVKSTLILPKPMSVEEAILQMETMDQMFYAFMNEKTERLNVVYKKKNNEYGHIEPDWKITNDK